MDDDSGDIDFHAEPILVRAPGSSETEEAYTADFTRTHHTACDVRWIILLRWAETGERTECAGFDLRQAPGNTEPITATLMRQIPVASIINDQRRRRIEALREMTNSPYFSKELQAKAKRAEVAYTKAGRPRYPQDHWQRVADVYAEAYAAGEYPTRAVAEAFTVSPSAAAKWVSRCRQKGLLGPTEQRKAGGVIP